MILKVEFKQYFVKLWQSWNLRSDTFLLIRKIYQTNKLFLLFYYQKYSEIYRSTVKIKKGLFLVLLVSFYLNSAAQSNLSLYQYLVHENYLEEAQLLKQKLGESIQKSQQDSFYWLSGQLAAKLKRYDSAAVFYEKIKIEHSNFYPQNLFSAAFNECLVKNYEKAQNNLLNIHTKSKAIFKLKSFELANLALLKRNLKQYEQEVKNCDTSFYATKESLKALQFIKNDLRNHKIKSPVTAALMSAIVPGSGKYYAGRTGEAFSSFLSVGFLTALVLENYRHYGINHGRTYLSLGFFSVFYIGNIWGSYFSVKRTNDIFNEKVDKNLLYHQQYTYDLFYR